jgi:poly-beta-hydroxybutyrate-responsive repressor
MKGDQAMGDEMNPFCNGKHHKMERFMEVCLLLLLLEETGHGYGLIERLSYFGFSEEQVNVSTLYRTLRKMEKEGSVVSAWEEAGQGPKRRVYNITDSGQKELVNWVEALKDRKAHIEKLINRYESLKY